MLGDRPAATVAAPEVLESDLFPVRDHLPSQRNINRHVSSKVNSGALTAPVGIYLRLDLVAVTALQTGMPRAPDATLPTRILDAAEQVVVEHGHETLNMRALAKLAGVSATTIYAHFESKAVLLRAVELRAAEKLNAEIRAIDPSLGPHETLGELGRRYIAFAEEHPRLYRLLFEGLEKHQATEEERSVLYFTYYAARNALERMAATNPSPFPPSYGAMMGWSLLHGFSTLLLGGRLQLAEGMEPEALKAMFMALYAHQPPAAS